MGISYFEIDILSDPKLRREVMGKSNYMRTVLPIFVSYAHFFGFSEFFATQQFGKLEQLLKD